MKFQRLPILTPMLVAVVVNLGSTLPCTGHGGGGHGGGAGHTLGGYGGFHGGPYGFRGGYGYRFFGYPGFYGYPFLGLGLGMGLGYGLGYGYGYGMGGYGYGLGGYNYPPYYPYGGGYPGYGAPVYTPPPPPAAYPAAGQGPVPGAPAGPAPGTPLRLTDTDVLLSIRVPPNAVVRINGEKTNQNGPRREFMSSGLSPGLTYPFVVTAQWTAPNGQTVDLQRCVHVQGGERRTIDFLTPSPPAPDVR